MTDDKDTLPSDAENGSLKPIEPEKRKPPKPAPDEEKAEEEDPSEQPS